MRKNYSYCFNKGFLIIAFFIAGTFLNYIFAANDPLKRTVVKGDRPLINLYSIPDQAFEQGIIRIKFSKTLENHLDNTIIASNPDGTARFGIAAVDLLNQQYGVVQVKKTFDVVLQNTQFNDRHRQWEFHLWYDLIIPKGTDIRSMVQSYSAQSEIQLSEPVYRKQLVAADINPLQSFALNAVNRAVNYVPNDPRYNEQWHYNNTGQQGGTVDADIDLPEAWDIIRGNSDVIVAIVDGGIDYTHSDLAANMWPGIGYNFVTNSSVVTPDDHGTHVAGTVAANTNNAFGVSGVAGGSGIGDGVRLMSCQVFTSSSSGGFENAPIWAADNGAAISQNSWGYTVVEAYEQAVLDAIDYFNMHGGGTVLSGGITIFAAGNSDSPGLWYPACYSSCFSVAATGNQDLKAWYSNYDTWVDISAPGGETDAVTERGVLSTLPGNTYGFYQGTSMACPHASGVAALILSLAPGSLSPAELKNILTTTTDNINGLNPTYTGKLGSGRLNAYQALQATQEYITPVANFSASPTTVCTGNSVTFTNLTLVGTSWIWSFPGGTPSSFTGQTPPPITYAATGIYDVSLTVSDGTITNSKTIPNYIGVKDVIADFSASSTTIFEGNSATFTDNSSCSPVTWEWDFPGGIPSSFTGQTPPPIFYSVSGNYEVTLTVTKPGVSDTKTKTAYITVVPPVFNMANGTITTCAGNFYDSGGSSGDYGDNEDYTLTFLPGTAGAMIRATFSSFNTESSFDYMYIYNGTNISAPLVGIYTGTTSPGIISASNPSGALTFQFTSDNSLVKSGWAAAITCLTNPPVAEFTASSVFPVVNQTVNFTDQSTDVPTSWTWTFSPNTVTYAGGTNANSQNPQVQFNASGLYTATLIVANAFGADTMLKANYINAYISAYCIPAYSSGTIYGDYISLVQLGSINNATVASSSPFYTYFNGLTTDLIPGTAHTLTVSPGTYPESNYIAAWIDFNQNGIFETTEKLGTILISGAAPLTGSISFTVPVGAVTGTTMMRVREVFNKSTIDPCSAYSFGETEDYNINIVGASKTLNLTVFLEGIYSGSGTMHQANNGSGPQYGVGISDQITVELRNSANYSIIEHTASNVDLGTTGLASITIPNSFSGSYYISIRHRNSITTTSASPVAFSASTIGYSFDLPSKAYNDNLKQMPDGHFAIFGGDVNQDGVVDALDLVAVDNDAAAFITGYNANDVNGDGNVDETDIIFINSNATDFISKREP